MYIRLDIFIVVCHRGSVEFGASSNKMSDKEKSALHSAIDKATQSGDASRVLQQCERALAIDATDCYALQCKATALLQQGKHEPAEAVVQSLESAGTSAKGIARFCAFAGGYCLYKGGKYADAKVKLLAAVEVAPDDVGAQHLLAQTHYNLDEFSAAAAIYEGILKKGQYRDDVERDETVTNLAACLAQVDAQVRKEEESSSGTPGQRAHAAVRAHATATTYDMLYNVGTGHIAAKEPQAALQVLREAERLCRMEHEYEKDSRDTVALLNEAGEGSSDADKKLRSFGNDVSPVIVQTAYAHVLLADAASAAGGSDAESAKHRQQAEALLGAVLKFKPSSVATHAAAQLNWAALRGHADFFDTHKKLQSLQRPAVVAKLTSKQRLYVRYNMCLLLLGMGGKNAECRNLAQAMIRENPQSDLGPMALTAVLLSEKSPKQAEDHMSSFLAKRRAEAKGDETLSSLGATLTMAQLALARGDVATALERLRADSQALATPAVVATVATAAVGMLGDVALARTVLDTARSKFKDSEPFLRFTARLGLAFPALLHDAVSAIDALLAKGGKSGEAERSRWAAGQVVALSSTDPSGARRLAKKELPSLPGDESDPASSFDEAVAEQIEAAMLPRSLLEAAGYRRAAGSATDDGEERKTTGKSSRKRPMRYPPLVVTHPEQVPETESKEIDPERWVPMNHRSYVKEMPIRRRRELKRLRAGAQAEKRRQALQRKQAAAAEGAAAAP